MQRSARIIVIAIALVAGLAAAYLASSSAPPPAPVVVNQTVEPSIKTVEVLTTNAELQIGMIVQPTQLEWKRWPEDGSSPFLIRKTDKPEAIAEYTNSIVRVAMLQGEPVRPEKLVKADGSGFMSALLPSGMRALSVPIDNRGTNSAGGFILPNDRVDVVRTMRDEARSKATGGDAHRTDIILYNIRVLAVGQTVQERNGERHVTGENATLELDAGQVELVLQSLRVGSLSLALRSLTDRNEKPTVSDGNQKEGEINVVRFGVSSAR
ncbi:MAG: Flp pilus assembly protein CpaB [Beijerinckiaceae bacterium]